MGLFKREGMVGPKAISDEVEGLLIFFGVIGMLWLMDKLGALWVISELIMGVFWLISKLIDLIFLQI